MLLQKIALEMILSYEIKIIVDLNITENDILIDKRKIQKQIDYNTLESKFELKQYENLCNKRLNR